MEHTVKDRIVELLSKIEPVIGFSLHIEAVAGAFEDPDMHPFVVILPSHLRNELVEATKYMAIFDETLEEVIKLRSEFIGENEENDFDSEVTSLSIIMKRITMSQSRLQSSMYVLEGLLESIEKAEQDRSILESLDELKDDSEP